MEVYSETQFPRNRVRALRHRAGLTQKDLAKLSGLSTGTVTRIDQNPLAKVSLHQGIALAKALGCDVLDLLPKA